ncbi:MAG: LamG-like jellyroll fold domain-containing protein [bacterium]
MRIGKHLFITTCLVFILALSAGAADYSWQETHAKVLPTGDLEWAPVAFEFEAGPAVRYIDYENGSDENDGITREQAWKHHPWDEQAGGLAKAAADGAFTYVFKGGVIYRGQLKAEKMMGEANNPIRLTRNPDWGEGDAVIAGSVPVDGGWQKVTAATAPQGLPSMENVWVMKVEGDTVPWALWQVDGDKIERLPIARTPNWKVTNWDDVKSEWWQWEDGKRVPKGSYGIDTQNLTEDADYYEDAIIRSEWGIVMSTPVPVPVTGFDADKKALNFEGFFTPHYGGRDASITKGMRYYLENKAHYIDESGEWWFAEKGKHKGNLYLRMDSDPNEARFELARHKVMIDLRDVENVEISGLAFHFTNLFTYGLPGFSIYEDDHQIAAVRLQGNVVNAAVKNNKMSHCAAAVIVDVDSENAVGENIVISDNDMRHLDYQAIGIENSYAQHGSTRPEEPTRINGVKVLRNNVYLTGFNPHRGSHGHTIRSSFAESIEIAGNILDKTYGSGIFIFGGKGSGQGTDDRPFSRIVIHHNKVTNPLLNTNDWGGIETWQGGPFFVYNNISGNPGGYRHWRWLNQKDAHENRIGHVGTRFGHAYYMDGAFKNYHFNNIAWGKENDLRSPLMNTAAFQEIHGYQNNCYNNTIYKFGAGSRRQTPEPGRNLFLGNIWSDISDYVFAHGPIPGVKEVNAADVGEVGEHFDYTTVGYANNVFFDIKKHLSTLESDEEGKPKAEAMSESLKALGAYAYKVGVMADSDPLADAAGHDFRPSANSAAKDMGIKPFVPWSLYATVGEWQFYQNHADPNTVIDSHWYMTPLHNDRTTYEQIPMWNMKGHGLSAASYVEGPLEDWTNGALKLNGKDQYLQAELPNSAKAEEVIVEASKPVTQTDFDGWLTITHPSAIIPGQKFQITVETDDTVPGDSVVQAFLGARKARSWAGTHANAEEMKGFKASEGKLTFTMTPKPAGGLKEYVVVVHYGPEAGWNNHVKAARVTVPYVPAREVAQAEQFRTPDIDKTNFIIETYIKVDNGAKGIIARKMDASGYDLSINGAGKVQLTAKAGSAAMDVASQSVIADGKWHHVLVEVDRDKGKATLFIDGKADGAGNALEKDASLSNDAPFVVGGSAEGDCLAATIDFLRVTRGSLADSRTTIDELMAWQFDGPFLKDFTGRKPADGKRDAGAIELVSGQ